MKIGSIELTQEKSIIAIVAIIAVIALAAYLVFYAPLMKELKVQYRECRSVENDVLVCRNIIGSAGKVYGERILMSEKDISRAIDELTKHGKSQGINFLSIRPEDIREEKGSQYKVLPIEMEIESTYEQLGEFLGSLDELEKGLVRVESFEIFPDRKDASNLITELVVDVYFSARPF